MANKTKLVFHSIVLTIYLLAVIWQITFLDFSLATDERILDMDRYKERYFTGWNFMLHVVYFALALSEDIQEYIRHEKKRKFSVTYLKAYLFTMLMVPCSAFVSSMFWGLYHYDRELVYPQVADEIIPKWFNHIIHSLISIFVILEFNFTVHHPPVSFKSAIIAVTMVNVVYYSVFFYHYSTIGRFLYPVFHQFTPFQMAAFIFAIYLSNIVVSKVGISVQNWIKTIKYNKINYYELEKRIN